MNAETLRGQIAFIVQMTAVMGPEEAVAKLFDLCEVYASSETARANRLADGYAGLVQNTMEDAAKASILEKRSKLLPIERDEAMNRDYIPVPGGWEVQTKGSGSTFRILDRNTGERYIVVDMDAPEWLVKMAMDARKAFQTVEKAKIAERERIFAEIMALEKHFVPMHESAAAMIGKDRVEALERTASSIFSGIRYLQQNPTSEAEIEDVKQPETLLD